MIILFLSFEIHILHKPRLSIIHVIGRRQLSSRIKKPTPCGIMLLLVAIAIIRGIHLIFIDSDSVVIL